MGLDPLLREISNPASLGRPQPGPEASALRLHLLASLLHAGIGLGGLGALAPGSHTLWGGARGPAPGLVLPQPGAQQVHEPKGGSSQG